MGDGNQWTIGNGQLARSLISVNYFIVSPSRNFVVNFPFLSQRGFHSQA
jgi:hypothetical protein